MLEFRVAAFAVESGRHVPWLPDARHCTRWVTAFPHENQVRGGFARPPLFTNQRALLGIGAPVVPFPSGDRTMRLHSPKKSPKFSFSLSVLPYLGSARFAFFAGRPSGTFVGWVGSAKRRRSDAGTAL